MESANAEIRSAIEFYDRITMLLGQKNITLTELCAMAECNLRTFYSSRTNHRILRGDVIGRMAKTLKVSTDYLIMGCEYGQTLNQQQETLWHVIHALKDEHLNHITYMARLCLRDQEANPDQPKPPRSLMKSE
jgi:hypothetical protein